MKKTITLLVVSSLFFTMPSTSAATKNVKNKQNSNACSQIQKQYQFTVMNSWYEQKSNDEDLISEIDTNISLLSKYYRLSNGAIKKEIRSWQIEEENTKSSILDADGTKLIKSIDAKINVFNNFNKLCKKIKTK